MSVGQAPAQPAPSFIEGGRRRHGRTNGDRDQRADKMISRVTDDPLSDRAALGQHRTGHARNETDMSELRYPNESREYRDARDALIKEEQALVSHVKSVAEKRRRLPPG